LWPFFSRLKLVGGVSLIAFIGHFFGFGREVATAYFFGASNIADGIIVGLVPLTLYTSVFGTAYANAAIVHIKDSGSSDIVQQSVAPLVILGAFSLLLFGFFAEYIVATIAPGLIGEGRKLAEVFVRFSGVGAALVSLSFLGRSLLYLDRKFVRASISDLMPNLGAIIGIVLLYQYLGLPGIVVGGVLGYVLQYLVVYRGGTYRLSPKFFSSLLSPIQKKIYKATALTALSYTVVYVDILVDRYFASSLGEGSVSAMNYAYKLMQFPLYTVIFAISTISFPSLIEAKNDAAKFSKLKKKVLFQVVVVALLAALIFIFFADEIVALLFGYGKFGSNDVAVTASVFRIYSIGLVGHALVIIASRIHYANENFRTPLIAGLCAAIVNVVLNFLLVDDFGVNGLAAATSIAAMCNGILLIYLR